MSGFENDYSDVLGGDGREETGGGLRKQLEEVLAMNRKLVERLESAEREKTVAVLFKEKGIDPKAAELMGNADPAEWIAKYGDLFQGTGQKLDEVKPPVVEQTPVAEPKLEADPDYDAEREAYEHVMGLQSVGSGPSPVTLDAVDKIKSFENEADLMKFLRSEGREG